MTYIKKLLKRFDPLSLSIALAVLITILVIVIIFRSNASAYEKEVEFQHIQLKDRIEALSDYIDEYFGKTEILLEVLAENEIFYNDRNHKADYFLEGVHDRFEDKGYELLFITDTEGNIIKGSREDIGKISVYEREYFRKTAHEQKIVISDPLISMYSNRSAVVVMVPFQDGGIVKGFIGAVVSLEELKNRLEQMLSAASIRIFNTVGEEILIIGKDFPIDIEQELFIVNNKDSINILDMEKGMIAVSKLDSVEWLIGYYTPIDAIGENLYGTYRRNLFLLILCLSLIIGFFLFNTKVLMLKQKELEETNKRLEELAYKDYLTGVYNYRYFHKKLEEELKKTDSCGKPMSIIMIGFHDFKKYTDKYGIDVGDKLLKDLSSEMNSIINKDKHILCRFSENIFSIILSETDEAEALKQAEIFRNKIDKYLHETDEHGIKFLNFSLGISVYPCLADSKEELVKSAVEAMQNSKHSPTGVKMYFSVFSDLKDKLVQTERELLGSLQTLLSIIDVRDHYTYGHTMRVVEYSIALAEEMGLSPVQIKNIKYGALLHDVGKIEIDTKILNKKGPLTQEEYDIVKLHSEYGANIVKPIFPLKSAIPIIRHHHEHFDGTGYPDGLKGEEIPIEARIIAVVDSFDAMTTDRPYKKAISYDEAVKKLIKNSMTQFDPKAVKAFIRTLKKKGWWDTNE